MWEELVVKRYLCAKTAGLLTLEYYLLISLFAEDLEIYGVKIVEWQNSNQRPGLTMSGQQIFRPIALLSKGTVVPTSLVVEFIGGCRLRCRGTEFLSVRIEYLPLMGSSCCCGLRLQQHGLFS